jgi:hypothetical protein
MTSDFTAEHNLVLAAEDFDCETFKQCHRFSPNDQRVISKLMAHGPVLLQGSRGSGKSALMREAAERLPLSSEAPALAVYLSLRHMPLLRSSGEEYQRILCELLIQKITSLLAGSQYLFDCQPTLAGVQRSLTDLATAMQKRIILMFDDAAHIGREASLAEFFDVFRTLSSSAVSCKATIYPGVTNFGNRFDVFNDATVVDVVRGEDQAGFVDLFSGVVQARFPEFAANRFGSDLPLEAFAGFVGKSVLGNMRSFIFACNYVAESSDRVVGLPTLGQAFLDMTTRFYWPLIEEVKPKLGKYIPVVDPATEIAEAVFKECGKQQNTAVLVHRDIVSRLSKAFEILEYVGFISKREASRGMKSGGRGTRYALNLCMLLENVAGARLTSELYNKWNDRLDEPVQLHSKGTLLSKTTLPNFAAELEPEIFNDPIETLTRSNSRPYGITKPIVDRLRADNIATVRDLYDAPEERLDSIHYIGEVRVRQLKNAVAQAIWL